MKMVAKFIRRGISVLRRFGRYRRTRRQRSSSNGQELRPKADENQADEVNRPRPESLIEENGSSAGSEPVEKGNDAPPTG
jgi:hypothetical protein